LCTREHGPPINIGLLGMEIINCVQSREEGFFGQHATQRMSEPTRELRQATSRNLGLSHDLVTIPSRHGFNILQSSPTILISGLFRLSPRSFQALQDPKEGRGIGRREIACHQLHSRRSRANCFGSSWIAAFSAGYLRKYNILKCPFFGVARRNRQVDQISNSTS
jgi:hypothetical protein